MTLLSKPEQVKHNVRTFHAMRNLWSSE